MRKYYDEDDEDDSEYIHRRMELISFLPAEHLTFTDGVFAAVIGVFVFLLLCVFPFPGLCPDAWNDAAIAAGLRPPETIFPGFWRVISRIFYFGGVNVGNASLMWVGRLGCAMTAGSAYLFIRSVLALLVRGRLRYSVRRYFVQRVAAVIGALFCACGDSVWRAGQAWTPDGLLVTLTILQATFFAGFLLNGRLLSGLTSMFLAGALAADSSFGFVMLMGCWGVFMLAHRHGALCEKMPILYPIVGSASKWMLTLAWAMGLIVGIALNCASFIHMKGLEACGMTVGDLPLAYLMGWWGILMDAANGVGWVLGAAVCVLPFLVAAIMLPRAVDEEHFLPYHVGVVFFFTGALAYSQVCMLPPLWFWMWSDAVVINSSYLRQLLMLAAACTVAFMVTTLGGDVCCRNYVRLAMMRFGELRDDDDDGDNQSPEHQRQTYGKRGGLVIFFVFALLLVAGVLPGRTLTRTREMLKLIEDYAREVVRECGSVHWIFTDGSFDSRIELCAAEQGKSVKALAMMKDNSAYQQYLRKRGVNNSEDLMSLSMGAPMTLRSWMRDKPDRMRDAAVQLGFELWKRDGRELPICSGVLARPLGMSNEECAEGVERANVLANRILQMYATGGLHKAAGAKIRELFLFVQWRIARLARMRAERADRLGNTDAALVDVKISDRLDQTNESLQKILADLEKQRATTLRQVTVRESLQLVLARADFMLARRYGEVILGVDPDEPNANFGVGMSYAMQKQWSRAEEFLRRGLVKKPKEPAMWNNLAMVCMYQKRFDEAEEFAKKALSLIPESAEVKDTLKMIAEKRREAAQSNKK